MHNKGRGGQRFQIMNKMRGCTVYRASVYKHQRMQLGRLHITRSNWASVTLTGLNVKTFDNYTAYLCLCSTTSLPTQRMGGFADSTSMQDMVFLAISKVTRAWAWCLCGAEQHVNIGF